MIKLTQLLNELEINDPNISHEKVFNYYNSAFLNNNSSHFLKITKPIMVKYGYKFPSGAKEFIMSLNQQTLNKLYRELKSAFN